LGPGICWRVVQGVGMSRINRAVQEPVGDHESNATSRTCRVP
jgi:hypothetical protein